MAQTTQVSQAKDLRTLDPKDLPVRDRILRTAIILFNQNGVHSTGIDRIIAESDVAKTSFYKHFPSKANLISAYLAFKAERRIENLLSHTVEKTGDPLKQLLGIFDSLEDWYREEDFCGCPFIRGLSDFRESDPGLYRQVQDHFAAISKFVEERLLKLLAPKQAKAVLPQLLTLIVGSTVMASAGAGPEVARTNKRLAQDILEKKAP